MLRVLRESLANERLEGEEIASPPLNVGYSIQRKCCGKQPNYSRQP
jgi:hypothetical protein